MSSVRFNPQPPRPEKKKKNLGEGADESRMARISFKRYLRELEEQPEEEVIEDNQVDLDPPKTTEDVDSIYTTFCEENPDLLDDADTIKDPDDAAEFLMGEIKVWLQKEGLTTSQVDDFLDGPLGNELYNMFIDGFY